MSSKRTGQVIEQGKSSRGPVWGFVTADGRTFTGYRSREAAEAGLAAHEVSDRFEEEK